MTNSRTRNNTLPQSSTFSHEKLHYESLISLFKWAVGSLSIFFGIIGTIIGFMTYQNGQEMRSEFRANKIEMNDHIKDIKDDLKSEEEDFKQRQTKMENEIVRKETMMESNLGAWKELMESRVQNTSDLAINEISKIQNLATTAARNKIDEIFTAHNFDEYVANIAKERMEPQIQHLVDKRINEVESVKKEEERLKMKAIIESLGGKDSEKAYYSSQYILHNVEHQFTDDEINSLFKIYDQGDVYQKSNVIIALSQKSSPRITSFFENELLKTSSNADLDAYGLPNIIKDSKPDLDFYYNYIKNGDISTRFKTIVFISANSNIHLLLQITNSKKIVDFIYKEIGIEKYQTLQNYLKNTIQDNLERGNTNDNYFLQKK